MTKLKAEKQLMEELEKGLRSGDENGWIPDGEVEKMRAKRDSMFLPWQESWEDTYKAEEQTIIGALSEYEGCIEVYHIGSTAIKGMLARPIIDILVCVENGEAEIADVVVELKKIGYSGNDVRAISRGDYRLSRNDVDECESIKLNVCFQDSKFAADWFLFDEIMSESARARIGYYKFKLACDMVGSDAHYYRLKSIYLNGILDAYKEGIGAADHRKSMDDHDEYIWAHIETLGIHALE